MSFVFTLRCSDTSYFILIVGAAKEKKLLLIKYIFPISYIFSLKIGFIPINCKAWSDWLNAGAIIACHNVVSNQPNIILATI